MSKSDPNIRVKSALMHINKTLALAESCTGGMVSKMVTDLSGSSQYFSGAIVAYSNDVKISILKVDENTLKVHGAVSAETALSMARGVKDIMNSDIGASCTGIAGPGGSTDTKPRGMVCMAVVDKDRSRVETMYFPGDRDAVRTESANHLLNMIADFIGISN